MFDLNELASQFETKTATLHNAREAMFYSAENVVLAAENLANAKTAAMTSGKIDGKNEEIRKAQYAEFCADEFAILREAETKERAARYAFEQAQADFDLTRYLLRIAELAAK